MAMSPERFPAATAMISRRPAAFCARRAGGKESNTEPRDVRGGFLLHRRDGEHVLAGEQVHRARGEDARRVGHAHGAIPLDRRIGERPGFLRDRMERRRDEHELETPQHTRGVAAPGGRLARGADGKVCARRRKRIPHAAQHFMQQAHSRARLLLVELAHQAQQSRDADDGVHRDAQLRFPASCDLLHATFDVGRRAQQLTALREQGFSGFGEHCAVATAVEDLDA
jgi:hypothetical protein